MWSYLILILVIVAIATAIAVVGNRSLCENFNNLQSKLELYDKPHECPYQYVNLYEDPQSGDKYVVKSKLVDQKRKELDNVYNDVGEFRESWRQLGQVFPNLSLCSDPYVEYLKNVRDYYRNLRYRPSLNITTTPIYMTETFTGEKLPQTQEERRNHGQFTPMGTPVPVEMTPVPPGVRKLDRTVFNSSQLNASTYMKPNSPRLNENEQIDTSVRPVDDRLPITKSEQNIKAYKDQMMVDEFEQQSAYQKQIYQLSFDIEQLKRELEQTRSDLVKERSNFSQNIGSPV